MQPQACAAHKRKPAFLVLHNSFNPIHYGHIHLVTLAKDDLERSGFHIVRCVFAPTARMEILLQGCDALTDTHRLETLRLVADQNIVIDSRGIDFDCVESMILDLILPELDHDFPGIVGFAVSETGDSDYGSYSQRCSCQNKYTENELRKVSANSNSQQHDSQQVYVDVKCYPSDLDSRMVASDQKTHDRSLCQNLHEALRNNDSRSVYALCPQLVADYLLRHRECLYEEKCWQCECRFHVTEGRYQSGWHQPIGGTGWRGPQWYCRNCWWRWRPTLLIGVTGATRAGKSTLTSAVLDEIESLSIACEIVQQDFHRKHESMWLQHKDEWLEDQETMHRCDWGNFLISVEEAAARSRIVLVEGYCILYDERLSAMLDHVVWLGIDEHTCRMRRRHWPDGWPSKDVYFNECIWPAHKRYKAHVFGDIAQDMKGVLETTCRGEVLNINGTDSTTTMVATLISAIQRWLSEQGECDAIRGRKRKHMECSNLWSVQ